MMASTLVVRPARSSDVASIESFVDRYAPEPRLNLQTDLMLIRRSCRPHLAYRSPSLPSPLSPNETRSTAQRLYGSFDVSKLVERSVMCVVALDGDTTVGFLAVSSRAPMPDTSGDNGHHHASNRLQWAKQAARDVGHLSVAEGGTVGSTLWLQGCATAPTITDPKHLVSQMLALTFERAPWRLHSIVAASCTTLEKTPIGAVLVKKTTMPRGDGGDTSTNRFALYSTSSEKISPAASSRNAALEDYDDFAELASYVANSSADDTPGGSKIGGFQGASHTETNRSVASVSNAMAWLVSDAAKNPETRAVLVAETIVGTDSTSNNSRKKKIVAFMAVTCDGMDSVVEGWKITHDLSVYDDFVLSVEEVKGAAIEESDDGDTENEKEQNKTEEGDGNAKEGDETINEESEPPVTAETLNPAPQNPKVSCAFRVTNFACLPGYETKIDSLFEKAFTFFPERDFCVCATSVFGRELPFTTLSMVRVPLNEGAAAFAEHSLFTRHREGNCDGFEVRRGNSNDIVGVENLLAGSKGAEGKIDLFRKGVPSEGEGSTTSDDNTGGTISFVASCDHQVVGYLVFNLNLNSKSVANKFRVDQLLDDFSDACELAAYDLNPVFAWRNRRVGFVLEALRLAGKRVLVYKHRFEDDGQNLDDETCEDNLNTGLNKLPDVVARDFLMAKAKRVRARVRAQGSENSTLDESDDEYALFVLSAKIASSVRAVVDARVVVVGGDDAALTAVETLVTHQLVNFTNVHLIAPFGGVFAGGIPAHSHFTSHGSLARLALGMDRVQYHEADLAKLERHSENSETSSSGSVFFTDGSEFSYDALALCVTARDETRRAVLGDDVENDEKLRSVPVERLDDFISNINGMDESGRGDITETEDGGCLLVYGATLASIGAVRKLLDLGFAPERILRVVPEEEQDDEGEDEPSPSSIASIAERCVASTFGEDCDALRFPGLPLPLRGYALAGCESHKLTNGTDGVRCYFSNKYERIKAIDAFVLLGADETDLDPNTFSVLDESGLVLDGGAVVDGGFRTNDRSLFAVGECAKFSKRVKGSRDKKNTSRSMRTRDQSECGFLLANAICRRFVPEVFVEGDDSFRNDTSSSTFITESPTFTHPRVESTVFPDGTFFWNASSLMEQSGVSRGDKKSVTTSVDSKYGKLTIDCNMGLVCQLRYCGAQNVDPRVYSRILGLPILVLGDDIWNSDDLWAELLHPKHAALFHEDFKGHFFETVASNKTKASAQSSVLKFVDKRRHDLPQYHAVKEQYYACV